MKDTYLEENKARRAKRMKAIRRPFISIDPAGKGRINRVACEKLGLQAGDRIEWNNGQPQKSESGMKLSKHPRCLQFQSSLLSHILRVDQLKRFYLD